VKDPIDIPPLTHHEARLEVALVDEFLRQRGHTRASLQSVPEDQRAQLLKLARMHAAEQLAEISARAHYVQEIHGQH
jgi:hypothetical protein